MYVEEARINVPVTNLLNNGGFEIWQRGSAFGYGGPAQVFTADGWEMVVFTGDNMTVNRVTTSKSGDYAATLAFTKGGSTSGRIRQGIQNLAKLAAQQTIYLTFCVWVKYTVANRIELWLGDYNGSSEEYESSSPNGLTSDWQLLRVVKKLRSDLESNTLWPHDAEVLAEMRLTGTCSGLLVDNAMCVIGSYPAGIDYVPRHPARDWELAQRYYEKQETACRVGHYANVPGRTTFEGQKTLEVVRFQARKGQVPVVTLSSVSYPSGQTPRGVDAGLSVVSTTEEQFIWEIRDNYGVAQDSDDVRNRATFGWAAEVH